MATFISHNPTETESLGEAWGRQAGAGWVIALTGDLGAGKTQLVRGMARGMGSPSRVHSPTFALINVYSGGRLALNHLDLYRLETRDQVIAAGLEEFLTGAEPGVTIVEWAERWWPELNHPVAGNAVQLRNSTRLRWANIEVLSETERRITYEDAGT